MFGLIRAWRRRRSTRRPFPQEWLPYLEQHVGFCEFLPGELHRRFLDLLKVFVWEKHFIGAGGMQITDEVRVVIAAAAVRLVLYLDLSYYDRLTEIIVYPSHYKHPGEDGRMIFGEAQSWGTVVVSWEATLDGLHNPNDGHDTATHEFAHVLDRGSGAFDGTPLLRSIKHYRPWAQVMSHHYTRLKKGGRREQRALRQYGATNEAEFFAVATESFFERPEAMHENTPDLYELLRGFYGCDPLRRQREARARSKDVV